MTPNPINALKITIYDINTPTIHKITSRNQNILKNPKYIFSKKNKNK